MNPEILSEITETLPFCPLCGKDKSLVLQGPAYPEDLSREDLLKVYRSSSDTKLMDPLVQCSDCELVYLNPRIRSDIGMESYSNAVDPTFVTQNQLRIETFSRALRKIIQHTGLKPSGDTKVLDVGCAGGAFVKAAVDQGFSAIGVEPSRWLVEFGRKEYQLDLRAGTLEDQKFSDKSFDLVTLWDVLEHLYQPQETLRHCHRVLKDNGYLVVNYPDYQSLARKLMGRRWPFFLSVHLFYFSPKTVSTLLEKSGFEPIYLAPHWQTLQTAYILRRAGDYVGALKPLEKVLRKTPLSTLPFTYNLGQTLLIAKKVPN